MAFAAKISCRLICVLIWHGHSLQLGVPETSATAVPAEVWISSFPRSGSSTMLSMMRVSAPEEEVFTLFEPCHSDDDMNVPHDEGGAGWSFNCPMVAEKLASCDFTGVNALWGWSDVHTTNSGQDYSPELASQMCNRARVRAIKMVGHGFYLDLGRHLDNMLWVLEKRPNMKVLNLVRDPRSILASWKENFPILEDRVYPLWREMCETYAANLNVTHGRVNTVVIEDLVRHPRETMQAVYEFLGFNYGSEQDQWVNKNFPQTSAECPDMKHAAFSDCVGQEEAFKDMDKWRSVLSDEEKDKFATYGPCKQVFEAFGYTW